MATHAHSTPTPLLPLADHHRPLLGRGSGRQLGPVTAAIRAMRADEPLSAADAAIQAIRDGLDSHFAEADRKRLRELRRRISKRIEADIAALDMLGGDQDLEVEDEHGTDLDAGEDGDDNGIADRDGEVEQARRHMAVTGEAPLGWRARA